MTYRPGYSEKHSPKYREGLADGQADAALASETPPQPPAYRNEELWQFTMYQRGYFDGSGARRPADMN